MTEQTVPEDTVSPEVRNLLYRRPGLYELVYPDTDEETPKLCARLFDRYLGSPPASILDIGCGTGRDLAALWRDCPDCVGIDANSEMIRYGSTSVSFAQRTASVMTVIPAPKIYVTSTIIVEVL